MNVVITGANRGIGAALCAHYVAQDFDVVGTSRHQMPPHWHLDVTDPASQNALKSRLENMATDLLICNAGVLLDRNENLDTGYPHEMWAETFDVNVTGAFMTIQSVLPSLRRAKNTRIAIISSQLASQQRATGGTYIYRASKAAALNLGRNLAADLIGEGIAVGIYHPGWVRSDMGGNGADISPQESATGLVDRFGELSVETTGCFLNWDGSTQSF